MDDRFDSELCIIQIIIAVMALETIHHFGFAPIHVFLLPSGEFPSHRKRIDSNRIRRSSTIPFNRFCIAGKKPQATIFRCEVSVDRSNDSADLTKCFELRSESSRESVLCALFLRNASLLSMELRFVVVFMCRACNFSRTSFNPAHRSLPRCAFSR